MANYSSGVEPYHHVSWSEVVSDYTRFNEGVARNDILTSEHNAMSFEEITIRATKPGVCAIFIICMTLVPSGVISPIDHGVLVHAKHTHTHTHVCACD